MSRAIRQHLGQRYGSHVRKCSGNVHGAALNDLAAEATGHREQACRSVICG